ncbi:MAG: hypothetical protein POG24_08055 [Acidocella sp.]|nr:hypothetical protein [Acidocella sp.]MDE8350337.1 hypothetical protein [Acidocella sp.]
MIQIGVKSDIEKLVASLSAFDEKQLPYTVSRAINMTLLDAQQQVQLRMPGEFILRRTWIVKGIKVVFSHKTNLVGMIFSRDPFMARQEYGGNKIPMDGGKNIAVPLAARPNASSLIPKALLPANLGKASYTISLKSGKEVARKGIAGTAFRLVSNGKTYLALRTAAGLQMMYLLVPSTTVKPRLNLGEITQAVVKERFAINFFEAAKQAMATRRAGGNLTDKP